MKELGNMVAALAFMLVAGNACAEMVRPAEQSGNGVESIDTAAVAINATGATGVTDGAPGNSDARTRARTIRVSGLGSNAALELFTRRAAVDEPGTIVLFGITAVWMAANRRRKSVY